MENPTVLTAGLVFFPVKKENELNRVLIRKIHCWEAMWWMGKEVGGVEELEVSREDSLEVA